VNEEPQETKLIQGDNEMTTFFPRHGINSRYTVQSKWAEKNNELDQWF